MAFPEIAGCIICEDVRPELNGKFALMGVFGFSPDAQILIRSRPLPWILESLALFFQSRIGGEGSFHVEIEVVDPLGKSLYKGEKKMINFESKDARANFTVKINNLKFENLGRFQIRVIIDEKISYEGGFLIKEGEQGTFASK